MKWIGLWIAGFILLLGFSLTKCKGDKDVIDTVASPLSQAVNKLPIEDPYYHKKVLLKTQLYYGARGYKRAWLKKRRPDRLFYALVAEVKQSDAYGFVPEDYYITELEEAVERFYDKRKRKRTPADLSNLDIRLTASFFLFTTHLIEGRIRYPGAREFLWQKGMPLENDIALLLKMESAADLKKEIESLHPRDAQYSRLQKALKAYRELEKADSFPPVSTTMNLKPGDSHNDITIVRKKLELTEKIKGQETSSTLYDERLTEAVKHFQERHGLEPDGIVDDQTAAFLNVPIKQKAELIALNLERLRWRPHLKGDKDEIVINVPEYMLRVYRNNNEKMSMRVILGAEYTPTPVFHDTLKYIVFSPTWMVPGSIFEKEFLPKLREDPLHFDTERFRFYRDGVEIDPMLEPWMDKELDVKRYSVIENPGDANSLGNVKFIMPNDFSVYLHDTPADKLFKREQRALSHGCIRLERPVDFALYLLRGQKEWNEKKIKEAMRSPDPLKVDLEETYPVYILYRTVWVDDEGLVHFRKDIYGHDSRHLTYLQRKIASRL
jgi:L,D-transpeptidase YcbB